MSHKNISQQKLTVAHYITHDKCLTTAGLMSACELTMTLLGS